MRYDSRYRDAEEIIVLSHDYDVVNKTVMRDDGSDVPVTNTRNTSYRLTTLPLPDPPPNTHMVSVVEDYTTLAKSVYDDPQKWWVIADANPQIRHPLDLKTADIVYLP